jgi:hypothetical protein
MPSRISVVMCALTVFLATSRLTQAQTDSTKASLKQPTYELVPISSNCIMAGHERLNFSDNTPTMSGPTVCYQRFPFRRPVYFSIAISGQWAEAKEDTVDLNVVMPELSVGIACNLLGIPSVDRFLTSVIPMDVALSLGGRVAMDYAPYYLERHYHAGYDRDNLDSLGLNSRWYFDHVGWSYSFFEGFLLDKSIGQKIETGVSTPVAGENRVSRSYVRLGLVFNL